MCLRAYSWASSRSLKNFEDAIDRTIGEAVPGPDRDDVVQPRILRRLRFEPRRDAEIVAGRINGFAPLQPRDDVGRSLADAAIGHADQGAVSGFQHQPHVERGAAIAAHGLPVAASIQYFAGKPATFERPA